MIVTKLFPLIRVLLALFTSDYKQLVQIQPNLISFFRYPLYHGKLFIDGKLAAETIENKKDLAHKKCVNDYLVNQLLSMFCHLEFSYAQLIFYYKCFDIWICNTERKNWCSDFGWSK